jgi:MFS transporter, MFS domain-containing protein family, molybdate-anion transporter
MMNQDENYGEPPAKSKGDKPSESKLLKSLTSKRVLSLGLASTMFEGSMYLFVFFWTPALRDAQASSPTDLPYGIIFASFMASMMASSLVFNHVMAKPLLTYGQLLVGLMGVSTAIFYALSTKREEQITFWLFCAFEACVGMYWPCTGYLKGKVVDDAVRAQVYGILRVPLNIFVVLSLVLTGDGSEYGKVFSICSMFLLASSAALMATMLGREAP